VAPRSITSPSDAPPLETISVPSIVESSDVAPPSTMSVDPEWITTLLVPDEIVIVVIGFALACAGCAFNLRPPTINKRRAATRREPGRGWRWLILTRRTRRKAKKARVGGALAPVVFNFCLAATDLG
jgi:hypothetical protein